MFRPIACLLACLCPAALACAQNKPVDPPLHLTTCQLENHPNLYDKKSVQVTGRVYIGKFDFIIDGFCAPHTGSGVWLDVGGDVESPGAFWGTLNDLPKRKGVDVRVRGVSIPVVRDALLNQFVNDIGAIRFRKPNGDGCGSDCLFYQVTATVRGRFFSGTKGGFGMNWCCHLLVVEQVLNLSSKRTTVPAGGEFQCTSDRWQLTPEELKALSAIPACSLRGDFRDCDVVLAKHWGDTINARDSLDYPNQWISRDMTRTYILAGGFIQKGPRQPIEIKPSSSIVRQVCHPLVTPNAASDHVYCRFYRTGNLENRDAAIALQKAADHGTDAWRISDLAKVAWLAFQDVSKQWNLGNAVSVKMSKCEAWPPTSDAASSTPQHQYGYCTFLAPNDMQEITVDLRKPGYLKPRGQLQKAVWIASGVETNLCHTEPGPYRVDHH
jgi:hypothetical protein